MFISVFKKTARNRKKQNLETLEDQYCTKNESVTTFALFNKTENETEKKQPLAYSPEEQKMFLSCLEYFQNKSPTCAMKKASDALKVSQYTLS